MQRYHRHCQCSLNTKGINATRLFHGTLDPFEKKEASSAWLAGHALLMSATSVIGMGIDKPYVRLLYTTLQKSLVEYYKEAGRVGRDGAHENHLFFYLKMG